MDKILRTRLLAFVAAIVTAAAGTFALAAWGLGAGRVFAFGPEYVPMAPPTALLFILLSLALAAHLRRPESRATRLACTIAGILTLAASGLTILQSFFDFALPWDHWFADPSATVGKIPLGRMSPLTAWAFVLTAGTLLGETGAWAARRWVRVTASVAALASLALGGIVALSYASEAPLFYTGGIVPMALLTALAFLVLNFGLLLAGLLGRFVEKLQAHDAAAHVPSENRTFSRHLLLTGCGLGLLIILAGVLYLRREQAAARLVVYAELEAITTLKANQITAWRNERMSEARFLHHTTAVVRDIAAFAAAPENLEARARVLDWLEPIKGGDRYASLAVLDPQARPLLSIPASSGRGEFVSPALFAQALAGSGPTFVDLHRDSANEAPHLDLLVPIRPRSGPGNAQGPPVAVIVMQLDARQFLFPLIENWPLPSTTAESLLVRREGDEVVYLNPARMLPTPALGLRRSIRDPLLSAARAARGEFGVHEGLDYRAVAVLSSIHLIPDSPWILIAEIAQAEAYAPIRKDLWQTGSAVGLLLLAVILAGTSIWRWRHANFLRRALAAEQEQQSAQQRLREQETRYHSLIENIKQGYYIADPHSLFTYFNSALVALGGYQPGELLGSSCFRLVAEEDRTRIIAAYKAWSADPTVTDRSCEFRVRSKAGRKFWVEQNSHLLRDARGRVTEIRNIVRDIDERKEHEQEIERLNRMSLVLSQVNQALVRTKNREALFAEVCRVLVEVGEFRSAWVGWLDQSTRRIEPVAVAGDGHGYVAGLHLSSDPALPEAHGPSGTAFREDRTVVCNDFFSNPATVPWREAAARSGFRSSISLPLRREGQVGGVLTVYAVERDFFQSRNIELLEETAGDISFALEVFAGAERRRIAEAAVRASEHRLQFLLTATPAIIYSLRPGDFGTTFLSPNIREVLGYEPEAALGVEFWQSRVHPDDAAALQPGIAALLHPAGPATITREYRFRHADGSWRWMHDETRLVRDAAGRPQELVGYWIDITTEKLAGQELRESEANYHSLVEQLPAGVFRKDPAGRYVFVSPWFCKLKGMKAEDFLGRTAREVADSAVARQDPTGRAVKYAATGQDHHLQVMETGQAIELVEEYPLPDGQKQFVHIIKAPIKNPAGKPIGTLGILFDITAGKRAEEALRESEQHYRLITENTTDLIWLYDLAAGSYLYVSPSTERMLGYTRAELMALDLTGTLTPESAATAGSLLQARLADLAKGATKVLNYTGEFELVHKSGAILTCEVSMNLLPDAAGMPTRILGVTRDITARRRAETALRESEYQLRQAHSIAGLGSYSLDLATGRWTSSEVLDQVLGLDPARDHSVEDWLAYIHPEDRDMMDRYFRDEVVGRKKRFLREYRVIRQSDQAVRWVWGTGRLDFDAQGSPVRMRGTIQDITERKQVELQLQKLSQAVEQSPTSIVITDLTGAIEYVNPWFTTLTGYTLEEVLGQNPRVLKSGDTPPETYADMWRTLSAGRTWRGELRNKKKNGEIFTELVVIAPVFGADGRPTHYVAIKDDITARARTEAALHESEARFRALFASSLDGLLLTRTTGEILTANPAACAIFRLTEEEIRRRGRAGFVLTDDPRLALLLEERRHHGKARGELTMVRGDGSRFEAEVSSAVFGTGENTLNGMVIHDITERKRAENALRESEARFRELFDLETDAILVVETETGRILQANQAAAAIYGYTVDELLVRRSLDLSAEPEKTSEVHQTLLRNLNQAIRVPSRLHRKRDGTVFPVEVGLRGFRRGDRFLHVAVVRDITEQVAARETLQRFNTELEQQVATRTAELADQTRQIQALLEAVPDTVMRLRSDGAVLRSQPARYGSPALAAITPPAGETPAAGPVAELIAVSLKLGRQALTEKNTITGEARIATPAGTIDLELRTAPTGDEDFVVFTRDITARKRLEQETAALLERERQVSEMKTRFISVTSHEFRTPMTAIMGSVELLANHLDRLDPAKRAQLFDRINLSLERMTAMLEDVLTLNRMDAGRTEVRLAKMDLGPFAHNVVDEIRVGDHDAHRFAVHLPDTRVPFVTDSALLHHILSNLLSNAVRYSPAGTVVTLRVERESEQLRLEVADQGIGIPPADLARVFEPFERGSNVGQIKGTGLGLNIVKRLTELLDGTVSVDPVPGGGTRFILLLPHLQPTPSAPPA